MPARRPCILLPLALSNHHRHARLAILGDFLFLVLARDPPRTDHRLSRLHSLNSLVLHLTIHRFSNLEAFFSVSLITILRI
jgi:hypothetical protein